MISLTVPSAIPFLDLLQSVAEEGSRLAGLPDDKRLDIGLAVREGAVNAMKHGHRFDPSKSVTLQMEWEAHQLVIRLRDRGDGFDPASLPDPTSPENLWRTSGRGLLLMRSLVDTLEYQQREDGMELILTKHLPATSAGASSVGGER